MKNKSRFTLVLSTLLLTTLACSLPLSAPAVDPQGSPTAIVVTVLVPVTAGGDTPTPAASPIVDLSPTLETTPAPTFTDLPRSTATLGPQCTILQRVNFRKGPGTAFDPPIRALPVGVVVIPQGFNANGIPDGSWVQVLDPEQNEIGWISAGPGFVDCTIDITQLPLVAVQAPPQPATPRVSNSQVDGSFDGLNGKVLISSAVGIDFEVRVPGEKQNGKFIKQVKFHISPEKGKEIYSRVETHARFCLFGGDGPCTPWPVQNLVYTWGKGGPAVEKGTYNVLIEVETDDAVYPDHRSGQWIFKLYVK